MKPNVNLINASAGTGKTFAVTQNILKEILSSSDSDHFKKILALTFTNKAANEMKERVLTSLKDFSNYDQHISSEALFKSLSNELNLTTNEIVKKSKVLLEKILHDFSFFNIDTIDSFNHSLIRSFARDLNLSSDFEVITDFDDSLQEAVYRVFENDKSNQKLEEMLKDFAIKKISEGKSWDVEYDMKEFAQSIFIEKHFKEIDKLSKKSIDDFLKIKKEIKTQHRVEQKKIISIIEKIEGLIEKASFEISFSRNSFPKLLKKVKINELQIKSAKALVLLFERRSVINKKCLETNSVQAEKLLKKLNSHCIELNKHVVKSKTQELFINSVIPSALIKKIKTNFKEIQVEKNQVSVSEFNDIINKEIANQPTPYLYEKLGVRYNKYFIDEFQDTSKLQWKNIFPLISHALDSLDENEEQGSLFLVGDPKQSLYRWRGADPKIFNNLLYNDNFFKEKKRTISLNKNFRSKNELISFNNTFFSTVSEMLTSPVQKRVYESASNQKNNNKKGGYVSIKILEKNQKKEQEIEKIINEVLDKINSSVERGYLYEDICVLVRDNKQASVISSGLNEKGVSITSSETTAITSSREIELLINLIKLKTDNTNKYAKFYIINYFKNTFDIEDEFLFFDEMVSCDIKKFFKKLGLRALLEGFDKTLFESIDFFVKSLGIDKNNNDPFVLKFKEIVHKKVFGEGFVDTEFLSYWEKEKEKTKISTKGNDLSVQVLTIHKSKGLEFPIVIYPFADSETYRNRTTKKWLPFSEEKDSFNLLIPFSEGIKEYNSAFFDEYGLHIQNQEFDNLNLLYVAFTRAEDELYVISVNPKKGSLASHSEIIRFFLEKNKKWANTDSSYYWGEKTIKKRTKPTKNQKQMDYEAKTISKEHQAVYSDDKIRFGKLFHDFMSQIVNEIDYKKATLKLKARNDIGQELKEKILTLSKKTIYNKDLKRCFSNKINAVCEKEIFSNKKSIIPDRISFLNKKEVIVIDYKTGAKQKKDTQQIGLYKETLTEMGYTVLETILVYLNPSNLSLELVHNK